MKVLINKDRPSLGAILAIQFYNSLSHEIDYNLWAKQFAIIPPSTRKLELIETCCDLLRILENNFNKSADPLLKKETDKWLSFSVVLENEMPESLDYLEKALNPVKHLVGETLSVSDLAVFGVLYGSGQFEEITKNKPYINIDIWMQLIQAQPIVVKVFEYMSSDMQKKILPPSKLPPPPVFTSPRRESPRFKGKFICIMTQKFVVRFAIKPSGYLHIGHVQNILRNQYYQRVYKGKLVIRIDDIDPVKENDDFEKVILKDLEILDIKPDSFTHISDYFDLMLHYCQKLLMDGKAFVDDTPAEQIEAERDENIESKYRNNSVEKNLELWEEMKEASETGVQCCVRAKIDMQSPNRFMRDPVLYRCIPKTHPRTGNKYKVYPTYDFACPIADSLEGVTHVFPDLRRIDPLYYWLLMAIDSRRPLIMDSERSRLSMTNTLLSRTQLSWFVDQGLVDGWDDPRLPTLRGLMRRGLVVEKLLELIRGDCLIANLDWNYLWAINRKGLGSKTLKYTALEENPVPVNLKGVQESTLTVPLHPKNPDVETKTVWVSPRLLIDKEDAKALKEGENAMFIHYGNVMIDKIHMSPDGTVTSVDATPNLDNKDKKTLKLSWLADSPSSPLLEFKCVYFDHIITKPLLDKYDDFKEFIRNLTKWEVVMVGESALRSVVAGDVVQLQRRGYFRVDVAPAPPSPRTARAAPFVLFHVPDGHTKHDVSQAPQ